MVDIMWFTALLIGFVCLWVYRSWVKLSRMPPGPKGWPMVGNAFQQDSGRPFMTWSDWAEMYGEVITINNFGNTVVICNSSAAAWEVLVSKSNDFAGHPNVYPLKYITDGGRDILFGDFDSAWAYRKKIFMKSTKMYGDGLDRLETIMMDIISELVDDLQKTQQEAFDPWKPIQLALCNVLSLLLLGDKFHYSDEDFLKLQHYLRLHDAILDPFYVFLLSSFPFLHYLPLRFCKAMDGFVNGLLKDWIPRMIRKRMAHYDANNPGCILDSFIDQHENDIKTGSGEMLEMRHVINLCEDMFLAGMGTSSTAMYNMIAILTAKPGVQAKAQAEIEKVLGGRRPTLQDKQSMPYFQAVLEEVLRYTMIVISPPQRAMVDSSISGYFIPKDTEIWLNTWHMCHDPSVWEDPWTFKPERFLDDLKEFVPPDHPNRKKLSHQLVVVWWPGAYKITFPNPYTTTSWSNILKNAGLLVFGAGRRICAGEQLARNRTFLITTSLLQNFEFKPAADDQLPQCDPRTFPPGFIFKTKSYKIRAIPRE